MLSDKTQLHKTILEEIFEQYKSSYQPGWTLVWTTKGHQVAKGNILAYLSFTRHCVMLKSDLF